MHGRARENAMAQIYGIDVRNRSGGSLRRAGPRGEHQHDRDRMPDHLRTERAAHPRCMGRDHVGHDRDAPDGHLHAPARASAIQQRQRWFLCRRRQCQRRVDVLHSLFVQPQRRSGGRRVVSDLRTSVRCVTQPRRGSTERPGPHDTALPPACSCRRDFARRHLAPAVDSGQ